MTTISIRKHPDGYRQSPSFDRGLCDSVEADRETDSLGPLIDSFVENSEMEFGGVFCWEPAEISTSRGLSVPDQTVVMDVDHGDSESAVLLVERDGKFSWHYSKSDSEAQNRGLTAPISGRSHFTVDLVRGGHDARFGSLDSRVGLIDNLKAKLFDEVKVYVFTFVGRKALRMTMKYLERKVRPGLVHITENSPESWKTYPTLGDLPIVDSLSENSRVLLLLHGTFSSTEGSFSELDGFGFFSQALQIYDLIIGYDHPTLSLDPGENAVELMAALEGFSGLGGATMDALGYSRGGLVLRSYVEQLLPLRPQDTCVTIRKCIYVAGTLGGTYLAEPEKWHILADQYTNMAVNAGRLMTLLTGNPIPRSVGQMVKGLGALVKFISSETVSGNTIPGLSAMEPDGAFVTTLNAGNSIRPRPREIENYTITSDFKNAFLDMEGDDKLLRKIGLAMVDPVVDRLMGVNNDLVVHVDAMNMFSRTQTDYLTETHHFGTNSWIFHTVYFQHPDTVAILSKWLGISSGASSFTETDRGGYRRSDGQSSTLVEAFEALKGYIVPAGDLPSTLPKPCPKVSIEVQCGDIVSAKADFFAVGHYVGVLPIHAEARLDEAVSGGVPGRGDPLVLEEDQLVLRHLSRLGRLDGKVGRIHFFPWGGNTDETRRRQVVLCGMGTPGTFFGRNAVLLYQNLFTMLNSLPSRTPVSGKGSREDRIDLALVLMGAGEGNLNAKEALTALISGLDAAVDSGGRDWKLNRIRIMEIRPERALTVFDDLRSLTRERRNGGPTEIFSVYKEPEHTPITTTGYRMAHFMCSAADLLKSKSSPAQKKNLTELLSYFAGTGVGSPGLKKDLEDLFDTVTTKTNALDRKIFLARIASRVHAPGPKAYRDSGAVRFSLRVEGDCLRMSAITHDAAVPEREIVFNRGLVQELLARMVYRADADATLSQTSKMLTRLVFHEDFGGLLATCGGPVVFEVDREAAQFNWELILPSAYQSSEIVKETSPIALNRMVSRQLRTAHSDTPANICTKSGKIKRALVIGDPGDPDLGQSLPGAEREPWAVRDRLHGFGIEVDAMIGAHGGSRNWNTPPAALSEVFTAIATRDYDLIHYAGHGDFDPSNPHRAGWIFKGGILNANLLERLRGRIPPIVIANACYSGVVSIRKASSQGMPHGAMLPSLAEEFMKQGVQHYVGTAWKVDDDGAVAFSNYFYDALLSGKLDSNELPSISNAVFKARRRLKEAAQGRERGWGGLWAAYQHYGYIELT